MYAAVYFQENKKNAAEGLEEQMTNYIETSTNETQIITMACKKANNVILQTLIIKCFKMYKISDKTINFMMKAMENLKIESIAGGQILAEVKI